MPSPSLSNRDHLETKRAEALKNMDELLTAIKIVIDRYTLHEISESELGKIIPVLNREIDKVHRLVEQC